MIELRNLDDVMTGSFEKQGPSSKMYVRVQGSLKLASKEIKHSRKGVCDRIFSVSQVSMLFWSLVGRGVCVVARCVVVFATCSRASPTSQVVARTIALRFVQAESTREGRGAFITGSKGTEMVPICPRFAGVQAVGSWRGRSGARLTAGWVGTLHHAVTAAHRRLCDGEEAEEIRGKGGGGGRGPFNAPTFQLAVQKR